MTLRYLILALTTRCNLACASCYNGNLQEKMDMSRAVLDKALELAGRGDGMFHLQLTGGEPTLVPDLIRQAVRRARSLSRPCTIGIQTNGTMLTPELAAFFTTNQVQVGVSLDGPPEIHEALRGQAAQTLRGLRMLETHGVPFRVTTVASQATVSHLDRLVWMLAGFGQARGIGLDLLINKGRAVQGLAPADVSTLGSGLQNMIAALNAVNRRRSLPLQLRELELIKQPPSSRAEERFFCHACRGESIAVHPDGRLFPCGQTLGDPRFDAGSVWQPERKKSTALSAISLLSEHCTDCPLEGRCPGECPSRLYYNRAATPRLACEMYRVLWRSISDKKNLS